MSALRNSAVAGRPGGANRLLAYAIVVSILAHALILLAAPGWLDPVKRKRVPASVPLVANLVPAPPAKILPVPAPASLPAIEQRPRPAPQVARPTLARPAASEPAKAKLALPESPAPVQTPAAAPAAPVPEPPRMSDPIQPQAAAPAATAQVEPARAAAAPSPAPAAPTSDSADPGTLSQYRIAIISAARRYKRYPRLALDNNWEGQAEVRMVIGADGSIVSLGVRTRSGYEVLDQQALEMIRKAKPLTPIPPALRGKGFTVDVPVVFSLREETG